MQVLELVDLTRLELRDTAGNELAVTRCAHGQTVVDQHGRLPKAIAHLRDVAKSLGPAEVIIHWADGGSDNIGFVASTGHHEAENEPLN